MSLYHVFAMGESTFSLELFMGDIVLAFSLFGRLAFVSLLLFSFCIFYSFTLLFSSFQKTFHLILSLVPLILSHYIFCLIIHAH